MIRRAEKKDIAGIRRLLLQVLGVHHVGRPDLFKEIGQKYTDEELMLLIENTENPIFVYESETGEVLGHCFCQSQEREESSSSYACRTLYIDDLCVEENARGQNIGKALYDHVKAYGRENGYYNITLHAWECNANAVSFYQHLGMKVQQYTMEELL